MSVTLFGETGRHAVISPCGRYRYRLSRWWGSGMRMPFVMLNPSTADGLVDDPTIRRCVGFAKAAGMDGIEVVNLFPWRATKPADLVAAHCVGHDVASTEQRDHHIREALAAGAFPIAAWGAHPMAARQAQSVLRLSDVWFVLGLTKDGHPRHPLYLPNAAEPIIVDRHDLVRP